MLKLIATNGEMSLFQTGFTTLYADYEALTETFPSGHIVDEEGNLIDVPNLYALLRLPDWAIIADPDEEVGKGRKRQFASRAEAARYAAQIRWGNRTPDASGPKSLPSNPLPVAATNDINEAIMTGAPYAPFLPENLPPDIKAALDEIAVTERAGLMGNSSSTAKQMLTEHYMTHLDPALYSPETLTEMNKTSNYYRQLSDKSWVGDQRRREVAESMADLTIKRVHERIYVTDRIGDQEALDYTKGMVASPKVSVAVAVHAGNLNSILDKGFSTQFETQESGGSYMPSYRAAYEAATFATHPATLANRRPIYANLHPVGVQSVFANRSEQYGQVQLVVKKSVHDRATFTVQDSLGSNRTPASVKGPITVGQASPNATKGFSRQYEHPADKPALAAKGEKYSYAEAQIHQGLSVSDIAYVTLPKGYKLPTGAAARLKALGIPVKRTVGNEVIEDSAIAKSGMMRLIATDGERSLYQTGFTTLREGTPFEETFPSGHVIDELGEEIPVLNIYSMFSQPWDIIAEPLEPLEKGRQKQFGSRSEAAQYAARIRWGTRGADATSRNDALDALPPPTMDVNVAIATGAPYIPLTFEGMPPHIQEGLIALENGSMVIDSKDAQSDYYRLHRDLNAHYMEHLDADGFSPETIKILESRGFDTDQTNANSKSISDSFSFMGLFEPSKVTPPNQPSDEVDNSFAYNSRQANSRASFANQMANATMMRHMEIREAGRSAEAIADTKLLVASPMKRIALARSEGTAVTILETGRITTQFETKKSAGALGLQTRAVHEAASFGIHPLAEPSRRPIYASLHPLGVQHSAANGSSQYGTVQFVMKPQVAARSTFTNFDSLKNVHAASPVNGRITSGQLRVRNDKSSPADSKEWLGEVSQGRTVRYAEAQIHGGIKLSEISHIAFSGTTPSKALVAAARKRGIPIVVLGDGTDGKGKFKIFPDPIDVAKSSTVDITDTIGRIWEAVDSLVVEKGRKRKFSTRTEAAQYAARIRWGTTSGERANEKPHMKAMREEAEALRAELAVLNQTVSFENMQRSSPASIKNPKAKGAWTDEKGDIQINTANEEMIPSPKLADLTDRVVVLGDKMNIEAVARVKQQIADGTLDKTDKEKLHAAYAKEMQNVVAELRPCGGVIEFNKDTPFTLVTSPVAFQDTVGAFSTVGKIMPTDWINGTKGTGLQVNSHVGVSNGSFSIPQTGEKPVINIPTMGTIQGRGEMTNLRVVGHETQHLVTHYRPAIAALEVGFMTHRTTGFDIAGKNSSSASRIRSTKRDPRSLASTAGKKETIEIDSDAFSNLYSGRRYDRATRKTGLFRDVENNSRYPAFELMTTGFEQVLSGNRDNFDNDHMGFVLGVMATA
jgi:hypothetical protein